MDYRPTGRIEDGDALVAYRTRIPIPPPGASSDRWYTLRSGKDVASDDVDFVRLRVSLRWVPLYADESDTPLLSARAWLNGLGTLLHVSIVLVWLM